MNLQGMSDESATRAALYASVPLGTNKSALRLLSFLPGWDDDDIRCRLRAVDLGQEVQYFSLSYTWGDPTDRRSITVNGHRITVTANLDRALRALRSLMPRTSRWEHLWGITTHLWVDALCINQEDVDEVGKQILGMGNIYRKADQVMIYLGHGTCETSIAYDYIRSAGGERSFATLWSVTGCLKHNLDTSKLADICTCERTEKEEKSLAAAIRGAVDIQRRPWWKRIWVVQELAMASHDPLVGCGSDWVLWSQFTKFVDVISKWHGVKSTLRANYSTILRPLVYQVKDLQRIRLDVRQKGRTRRNARPGSSLEEQDMIERLRRTRSFMATKQHDKVYALLGMSKSRRWRNLKLDYSVPISKMLKAIFVDAMRKDNNLDMLALCQQSDMPDIEPSTTSGRQISWVPDLGSEAPSHLPPLGDEIYGGLTFLLIDEGSETDKVVTYSKENESIVAKGYQLGIVEKVLPKAIFRGDQGWSIETLYRWAPVWRALEDGDSDYPMLRTRVLDMAAMAESLSKDQDFGTTHEPPERLEERYDALNSMLPDPEAIFDPYLPFTTRDGLVGVGSDCLLPGDLIVKFHSSGFGYALRKRTQADNDNTYWLRGTVYIDLPGVLNPAGEGGEEGQKACEAVEQCESREFILV